MSLNVDEIITDAWILSILRPHSEAISLDIEPGLLIFSIYIV
jgi:hypothetical protein